MVYMLWVSFEHPKQMFKLMDIETCVFLNLIPKFTIAMVHDTLFFTTNKCNSLP